MSVTKWAAGLLATVFLLGTIDRAEAGPINLNDFFADASVSVSADGSMATLAEDPALFSVLLANDPFFGDPNVIVATLGSVITFDYEFIEPVGNDDVFSFGVLDADTGNIIGSTLQSFDSAASGSVSIDLSAFVGDLLGFQFELAAGNTDTLFSSTAKVSNFQISAIPLPMTGLLLLGGLGGLLLIRRRA